jgi:glycosyl transferase family 25
MLYGSIIEDNGGYSMRCLVINLDRSVDRLAHMTAEFANIGVAFERVAAVDASTGSPIPAASHLTKPEVACFLSHRKCWQTIVDGADQYGAIFEDDAVLSRDAGQFLSDDGWVPADADIVKLETLFGKVRLAHLAPVGNGGHSIARLVGEHIGAAGYVISKAAAQKLLLRTRRLKEPVDLALFSPNSMVCALNTTYQVTPAVCAQHRFLSEREPIPTLIQMTPHPKKGMIRKIRGELSRAFAHLRNGTFWRTRKVDLSMGWTRISTSGVILSGPRPDNEYPTGCGYEKVSTTALRHDVEGPATNIAKSDREVGRVGDD